MRSGPSPLQYLLLDGSCSPRSREWNVHRNQVDCSLFDLSRLTAKTNSLFDLIQEALSANDCARVTNEESDLQLMLDSVSQSAKLFGLTISLEKTEILHQPAPGGNNTVPVITIDSIQLANAESFRYLGSIMSQDGTFCREADVLISKASQALGRLRNRVLNHHNIRLSTKLKVYNAVVIPSLIYGCEFWILRRRYIKKPENFHMRAFRSILGICWQGHVANLEVLDRAESTSIESILIKAQLRWVGHVFRVQEYRITRHLLYGELVHGKRHRGRP